LKDSEKEIEPQAKEQIKGNIELAQNKTNLKLLKETDKIDK